MPAAAPRLDPRLIECLERLERKNLPYAEIRRALVVRARELVVPPPSYEHVRRLAKEQRLDREAEPAILPVAIGVALGTRHGNELLTAIRESERSK